MQILEEIDFQSGYIYKTAIPKQVLKESKWPFCGFRATHITGGYVGIQNAIVAVQTSNYMEWIHFRGRQLCLKCLPPLGKVIYPKEKILPPMGENSFILE